MTTRYMTEMTTTSTRGAARSGVSDFALFVVGAVISAVAYLSVVPTLAAGLFFVPIYLLLRQPMLGGVYEKKIFTRVFAVGFVASGVAAIYANHFNDEMQLYGDAGGFFEMATGAARGLNLEALSEIHEGALAIIFWEAVYDFFAALGFPRERYIGIMVNVAAVALSGVVALKMARLIFGHDPYRFKRLILLFSTCGLFWLFAGLHLRDSLVLLAVTALVYVWVYFLAKPKSGWRLVYLLAFSLLTATFFEFLRGEFLPVPFAMAIAGVAALAFSSKTQRDGLIVYLLLLIGMVVITGLSIYFGDYTQQVLVGGSEGYLEYRLDQNADNSLGMKLIVNQVLPIRLTLGAIYLFVYPIPIWFGFQVGFAYEMFKSLGAVFFYFVLPLLVVTVRQLWRYRTQRTSAILFILFIFSGFTIAVAATSLETRHFGAFVVPLLVLVLLPDMRIIALRQDYKKLLIGMLCSVVLVHLIWAILKNA